MSEAIQYFPPVRVVIDADSAEAVSYSRAQAKGIEPDLVLVRDDGWTLGARWEDAVYAWQLWAESWVFFAYREAGALDFRIAKLADFGTVVLETMERRR